MENHLDFNGNEVLTIVNNVNSPFLGINFDSGNFVQVHDNPAQAMGKLAKHVYATHIKDLRIQMSIHNTLVSRDLLYERIFSNIYN
jgi:sugar phosphate isomerase/epimerase